MKVVLNLINGRWFACEANAVARRGKDIQISACDDTFEFKIGPEGEVRAITIDGEVAEVFENSETEDIYNFFKK